MTETLLTIAGFLAIICVSVWLLRLDEYEQVQSDAQDEK